MTCWDASWCSARDVRAGLRLCARRVRVRDDLQVARCMTLITPRAGYRSRRSPTELSGKRTTFKFAYPTLAQIRATFGQHSMTPTTRSSSASARRPLLDVLLQHPRRIVLL